MCYADPNILQTNSCVYPRPHTRRTFPSSSYPLQYPGTSPHRQISDTSEGPTPNLGPRTRSFTHLTGQEVFQKHHRRRDTAGTFLRRSRKGRTQHQSICGNLGQLDLPLMDFIHSPNRHRVEDSKPSCLVTLTIISPVVSDYSAIPLRRSISRNPFETSPQTPWEISSGTRSIKVQIFVRATSSLHGFFFILML